jgi:hypothetical protein
MGPISEVECARATRTRKRVTKLARFCGEEKEELLNQFSHIMSESAPA